MMKETNNKRESFYDFCKTLGLFGSFLVGVVLVWWGSNILINDLAALNESIGLISLISLTPLFFGVSLAWLSISEFIRKLQED